MNRNDPRIILLYYAACNLYNNITLHVICIIMDTFEFWSYQNTGYKLRTHLKIFSLISFSTSDWGLYLSRRTYAAYDMHYCIIEIEWSTRFLHCYLFVLLICFSLMVVQECFPWVHLSVWMLLILFLAIYAQNGLGQYIINPYHMRQWPSSLRVDIDIRMAMICQ